MAEVTKARKRRGAKQCQINGKKEDEFQYHNNGIYESDTELSWLLNKQ